MIRRTSLLMATLLLVTTLAACTRSGRQQVETGGAAPAGSGSAAPATGGSAIDQSLAKGDFGTLKQLCGPAPSGEKNGSADQGVTSNSVEVGTFSDPGNSAQPGLDQELFDSGEVFTAWCNSLGGINGRHIKLDEHDSALFSYEAQMVKACQSDFFLAGGGAVFDDSGQKTRLKCLLPDIPAFQTTPQSIGSDLSIQVNPAYLDKVAFGVGSYINATFPDSIKNVGVLTGNVQTTITLAGAYKSAAETLGWKFTYNDQYNAIGESTWTPYAQKIAQAKLKGLLWVGEPADLALLIQALAQIGYKLDWIVTNDNNYDVKLTSGAKGSLDSDPVYTYTNFTPFEYENQSPSLQAYEALFSQFKPKGLSRALLGQLSFSAWLLFADAAKSCGANLTRLCVYDKGMQLEKGWTGGGLSAKGPDCSVNIKAIGSGFQVIPYHPNDSFWTCNPKALITLPQPLGQGTTLQQAGKSLKDLK